MSDVEKIIKKILALQQSLGLAATWRFLSLIQGDATDYVMLKFLSSFIRINLLMKYMLEQKRIGRVRYRTYQYV